MRKFGVLLVSAAAAGLWIPAAARANDTAGGADAEPVAGNDDVVILGKSHGQEVGKTVTPLKDVPKQWSFVVELGAHF